MNLFYYHYTFQSRLLAYTMEKCKYSVLALRPSLLKLSFLYLTLQKILNFWDRHFENPLQLSPIKEKTKKLGFSDLSIMSIFRTEASTEYSGLDTKDPASFTNNTGYTLQLQASTQVT